MEKLAQVRAVVQSEFRARREPLHAALEAQHEPGRLHTHNQRPLHVAAARGRFERRPGARVHLFETEADAFAVGAH